MKRTLGPKPLAYPAPVFVIGTYDAAGNPNAMTASWAGICCSQPPCIAVSLRKATHTHGNLTAQKAFTLNIPSERHVKEADLLGLLSGRSTNKLSAAGLTAVRATHVNAPYIAEFPLVLECRVTHMIELGSHTQFVGEVLDILADETVVTLQGTVDIKKVRPLVFAPDTQAYYGVGSFIAQAFAAGQSLLKP